MTVVFEHSGFPGPYPDLGEAIAGASMEKEAMNGTANAPAAATPLSRVRLLGGSRSRFPSGFSVLTCTSSPLRWGQPSDGRRSGSRIGGPARYHD